MSEQLSLSDLQRLNDDLKIEILTLKQNFHSERIHEEKQRQDQRAAYESTVADLQKELLELKQKNESEKAGEQQTSSLALERFQKDLETCQASRASFAPALDNISLFLI
jgi:hypothetical protein